MGIDAASGPSGTGRTGAIRVLGTAHLRAGGQGAAVMHDSCLVPGRCSPVARLSTAAVCPAGVIPRAQCPAGGRRERRCRER